MPSEHPTNHHHHHSEVVVSRGKAGVVSSSRGFLFLLAMGWISSAVRNSASAFSVGRKRGRTVVHRWQSFGRTTTTTPSSQTRIRGKDRFDSIGCERFYHSSSSSSSWLAAVPELDDSFSDDGDYNAGYIDDGDFSLEGPPDNFYANDPPPQKEEEIEIVNPFSFPMPRFAYTEDGNTLEADRPTTVSSSSYTETTFTAPEYMPPVREVPQPRFEPSPEKTEPTQSNDRVELPVTLATNSVQDKSSISNDRVELPDTPTTNSGISSNLVDGDASEPKPPPIVTKEPPPEFAALPKAQLGDEFPVPPKEQPDDEFSFPPEEQPDSVVVEDRGPVKPLVAPLRLNKTPQPSTTMSSSSSPPPPSVPAIQANGLDDLLDTLTAQLKSVEREIEVLVSDGEETTKINLNSPKQVSQLLFGRPDMSTNKSTLDGMAGSNILAKLILEYRDIKRRLNKATRDHELRQQQQQQQQSGASDSDAPGIPKTMNDPVLLFDTSSFIFRAYYSSPPIHRGRDGMPIGAVMGFCSMMNKLLLTSMLKGETPRLIHCLDAPGPSFRNQLYPDYKAHRPPCPLDLVPQFELINKAARAYGMIQIQADGFEADDVIATLATIGSQTEGLDVKILSGDKDLMQLVTEDDPNDDDESYGAGTVYMMDPMTSKVWTHDMVLEKWGVKASQLGDVLALAGDSADNIPGVPGIGPKIAAQLLEEFETLESLLDNTDKIKQAKRREKLEVHADSARISRQLVELERGLEWSQLQAFYPPEVGSKFDDGSGGSEAVPKTLSEGIRLSELRMQPMNADRILAFYDEMGFFTLKQRLLDRLASNSPNHPPNRSGPVRSERRMVSTTTTSSPPLGESKVAIPRAKAKATTPKRNRWEKKTRGIPNPEDFKDVPF